MARMGWRIEVASPGTKYLISVWWAIGAWKKVDRASDISCRLVVTVLGILLSFRRWFGNRRSEKNNSYT